MRSIKLLAVMAVLAALVAGPVLAQDATMAPAPAATDAGKTTTAKHHAKKHAKKHHAKKTDAAAPAAPAAQ